MPFIATIRTHKISAGIILLVLIGVGYYGYQKMHTPTAVTTYKTAQARKDLLTVSISGSGQIAAESQVDLKPQTSGTIKKINVAQGQQVKSGATLVVLDQQSAASGLRQAQVSLEQAKASYAKLVAGPTDDDLAANNLSVRSAEQAVATAQRNYANTVAQQQQAVDKAYSSLLNSDLTLTASDNTTTAPVTLSGNYTGTEKGSYTIKAVQDYYIVTGLGSQSKPITRNIAQPLGNGLYITFGNGFISQSTTWTIEVPNTRSNSYLNNMSAYTSALQGQSQAIASAQASIDSAQTSLEQTKLSAKTKIEPPSNADVLAAQAQVSAAQVKVEDALAALRNTTITAPFDGTVAKLTATLGEQASPSTSLGTFITPQQIAQVSLNEVDAAKVKLGQKATLSFSALDNVSLTGTVVQIDTIATVTQNVVSFAAKIALDTQNDQVKPGMSVSATIITEAKPDVLLVPSSAVKSNTDGTYVETLVNGKPVQHSVQAGLSNDTDTEVTGDIHEGDTVVTQTNSGSATATPTTQAQGGLGNLFRVGGGTGAARVGGGR